MSQDLIHVFLLVLFPSLVPLSGSGGTINGQLAADVDGALVISEGSMINASTSQFSDRLSVEHVLCWVQRGDALLL